MDSEKDRSEELLRQAASYLEAGDAYHAVKLLKRLIRLRPEWSPPHRMLADIYYLRREWKPLLYYCKKVVALDPSLKTYWWRLGLAATANGRRRLAQAVWNKFGIPKAFNRTVSVQLKHQGLFELVWGKHLDPVRVEIRSIPHPASGFRFRDVLLIDRKIVGYHVAGRRRYPVFESLQLYKRSVYQTCSCLINSPKDSEVRVLRSLCKDRKIGMEFWSEAGYSNQTSRTAHLAEHYSHSFFSPHQEPEAQTVLALAGKTVAEVTGVLQTWAALTGITYSQLQVHN